MHLIFGENADENVVSRNVNKIVNCKIATWSKKAETQTIVDMEIETLSKK